jgi:hypothetical protein
MQPLPSLAGMLPVRIAAINSVLPAPRISKVKVRAVLVVGMKSPFKVNQSASPGSVLRDRFTTRPTSPSM